MPGVAGLAAGGLMAGNFQMPQVDLSTPAKMIDQQITALEQQRDKLVASLDRQIADLKVKRDELKHMQERVQEQLRKPQMP